MKRKATALGGVVSLYLFALASLASAAPVHPVLEDRVLEGFNHACGVAVDSEGDVYVASAGESKIRIFDAAHTEFTGSAIENANEPCGLAVDSEGKLYVSEKATGEVVKYEPSEYPFIGPPSYGPPAIVDASGDAKGIFVDPAEDRLYVAMGTRIDTYNSEGTLGINEVQRVGVGGSVTGGEFTLTFKGEKSAPIPDQTTGPIKFDANAEEVEEALLALAALGPGDISVEDVGGFSGPTWHVTFTGPYGSTDIETLVCDSSGLTGGGCFAFEQIESFDGHIATGELTEATGVAAYTYKVEGEKADRYLFVADPDGAEADKIRIFGGSDLREMKPRTTIEGVDHDANPATPEQKFGFGAAGAYLAADRGSCPPTENACAAGHFFAYDAANEAVDEFEATGQFLTQISSPEPPFAPFADAEPTAIAVERSGGAGNGTLYVTSGSSTGAKALAFGPLALPSRPPLPNLSLPPTPSSTPKLENACGVAVDAYGNRYVAAEKAIYVYSATGDTPLTTIEDPDRPCDLAVDSLGNVWALESAEQGKAVYFTPDTFPPVKGTEYGEPTLCAANGPPYFPPALEGLTSLGLDPRDDHVFVNRPYDTIELDSAANGCKVLNGNFAPGFIQRADIAVYGANGNVYLRTSSAIVVMEEEGKEVLSRISGAGSPAEGPFSGFGNTSIAVDQENGHVVHFRPERKAVEEFEASGAFVAEFGPFESAQRLPGIAVDNGAFSPNRGNVYLAYDDPLIAHPFNLTAFGPLNYGEPPIAVTGTASEVGEGKATLNGSVDPRGFEVEECKFEYLSETEFEENIETAEEEGHEEAEAEGYGFQGAEVAPCAESPAEIGKGIGAVAVHAEISGLDLSERHRFGLVAKNKYGEDTGDPGLFGPPIITPGPALPSYAEATLGAVVDPSGLQTKCHFEYGTSTEYGNSTSETTLQADAGPTPLEAPIFELTEGTTYHFRALCENEASTVPVPGSDQSFKTRSRPEAPPCPNKEFRTGRSAALPDCRAYELVTPADTSGASPFAVGNTASQFNNWLVAPRGEGAGESVAFFINGTSLPGFDGNGRLDGYRAARAPGAHPEAGWETELTGPSYLEAGGDQPGQLGVAADQRYWFWSVSPFEVFTGTLDGNYLRTPSGFEAVGQGSLSPFEDPGATPRFLTTTAAHVIFESDVRLEPGAPPSGTTALYDRGLEGPTRVVSLKPGGTPFAAGEDAIYLGSTEDGSAIAFQAGGSLYVRRGNAETVKAADAPFSFAGLSEDGSRLFYVDKANGDFTPAVLSAFDLNSQAKTEIAADSRFVNVAADGSRVYLTSEKVLDQAEEGVSGEDNLYLWDGSGIRFIATLAPSDLTSIESLGLNIWTSFLAGGNGTTGRALDPSRSTPHGEVLAFESHTDLTPFESEGHAQVYRYDATDDTLLCVSCDPGGSPPSADAALQVPTGVAPTAATTLIPNLTDDGMAVFFESEDPLLPEDANSVRDVYEWKALGKGQAGSCDLPDGCLALISSGQGERDSFLYGMSADGHDVFFTTLEKLHGKDIVGSPSIYDARAEGGIPDPPAEEDCQGDACQGQGSEPPALPAPTSTGTGSAAGAPVRPHCPKGKRRVVRRGKARCVKRHAKRHRRADRKGKGRAAR